MTVIWRRYRPLLGDDLLPKGAVVEVFSTIHMRSDGWVGTDIDTHHNLEAAGCVRLPRTKNGLSRWGFVPCQRADAGDAAAAIFISITDYGAKGDNFTDDAEAIDLAFADAARLGGAGKPFPHARVGDPDVVPVLPSGTTPSQSNPRSDRPARNRLHLPRWLRPDPDRQHSRRGGVARPRIPSRRLGDSEPDRDDRRATRSESPALPSVTPRTGLTPDVRPDGDIDWPDRSTS